MKRWSARRGSGRILAYWIRFARRWRRRGIRGWRRRNASGGGGAEEGRNEVRTQRSNKRKEEDNAETQGGKRTARTKKKLTLTTPDLVLLSLLAERPMHGYQANAELERREIRDWAGI